MKLNVINLLDNINKFNRNYDIPFSKIQTPSDQISPRSCLEILQNCKNLIFLEERPVESLKAFNIFLKNEEKGIIISRNHPEKFCRSLADDQKIKLDKYWLSSADFDYVIHPWEIGQVIEAVQNFIKKNNSGVIFLNGLEYLSTYNNPNDIMKIVYFLINLVEDSNVKLLITMDPLAINKKILFDLESDNEIMIIPGNPLKEVLN